jgi:hypothetical protein
MPYIDSAKRKEERGKRKEERGKRKEQTLMILFVKAKKIHMP